MTTSTAVLVMTDVAGSTRLWLEHPDEMDAVMARHHAIVHAAVAEHGGWRPVDQGEGDAVLAAFESATAALAAVLQFQRALAAEQWPAGIEVLVRVGVHAGEVTTRDGNLFGTTVNRCARLRGLGAGGQVLLSAPVFELVRDRLPDGVGVLDLGEHRMKDLARPEHVHQLTAAGLAAAFRPLAGLDRAAHNLPLQATPLLGREREVTELVDLVARERLVTITGFGGMGKTRLALQVAAELADGDGDGVWFVDLSTTEEASAVATQVAAVLGVSQGADGPMPAVTAALATQRVLLVLDNLEQLLPDVAAVVEALGRSGPGVHLLATCREPLRVRGEQEYVLEPLPVPPPPTGVPLSEAEIAHLPAYAAVALFLARASAARRSFTLTAGNAAAVAGICARLEGLPLALELAAARTRSLSPEALLPRLDHALRLLTGGDRTLPARHQTLRATIAWSYDALEPSHQQLLDRLSVFPGSFTLEAAEAVCGATDDGDEGDAPALDELDVLDGLGVLVERSLVRHLPTDGSQDEDRYTLLVTIRAFAAERLAAAGDDAATSGRHAAHFTDMVRLPPDFTPEQHAHCRRQARTEFHNVLQAVDWHSAHGDVDDELTVDRMLFSFLINEGRTQDVVRLGERVLARPAGDPALRVSVLATLGAALDNAGATDVARRWSAQALDEARQVADVSVLAYAQVNDVFLYWSRTAALPRLVEAQRLVEELRPAGHHNPAWWVCGLLEGNAHLAVYVDPAWAEAALRRELARELGSEMEPFQACFLGEALVKTSRPAEALAQLARFEPDGGPAEWFTGARINGLMYAVDARIAHRELALAAADLDGLLRLTAAAGDDLHSAHAQVRLAVVDHLTGAGAAALDRLRTLLETADVPDEAACAAWLAAARLHREAGDSRAAASCLARSWAMVARADAYLLSTLLNALLEGARQVQDDDPLTAARLVALVQAHRGPFTLSPFDDVLASLAALGQRLGDEQVVAVVAEMAGQPLPDDPDWAAVLTALPAR